MSDIEDYNDNDIIKILVATDIHLGYGEKDTIRGYSNVYTKLTK